MDQPAEANILPGMTASVTATGRSDSAGQAWILVPAIAVLDAPGDHPYVYVYDAGAGAVRMREVKIGRLEGSASIQILDGLRPGEQIVVAGVTKLSDGMKIRPWEKQREGK
jgi:multidrug efflux pump subunit AcrA (membrane-fusion protein)